MPVKRAIQKYPSISVIIGIISLFLAIGGAVNVYRQAAMQQFELRLAIKFELLENRINSQREVIEQRIEYLERYFIPSGPRRPQ